jgi:hypothetical protein
MNTVTKNARTFFIALGWWGSLLIISDMTPRLSCSGLRGLVWPQALEAVFTSEDEPAITQAGVHVLVVRVPGEVSQRFPAMRAAWRKMREDGAVVQGHDDLGDTGGRKTRPQGWTGRPTPSARTEAAAWNLLAITPLSRRTMREMRSHGDGSVSVDRSGEKRSHAQPQTISGAESAAVPHDHDTGMRDASAMSRNQGFTARVRRLFWRPSDLSLAIGRICQICDRATRRTEVAHYRGSRDRNAIRALATWCNLGRMPDDRSTGQDRKWQWRIHARSYLRCTWQQRSQSRGRPMP